MGISAKRFGGWVPRERTTVTVVRDGIAVEWETVADVEWDGYERSLMLALAYYESSLCRKCGTPLVESTDSDNDPDNPMSLREYVADLPTECLCCKVLVRSERDWSKSHEEDAQAAIHTASLRERPKRRPRKRRGQVL